jgi:hypothetical protein
MHFDWHQLWKNVTLPDNIPIVLMMVLIPYYLWYGFREAVRNDRLITQLEADRRSRRRTTRSRSRSTRVGQGPAHVAVPARGVPRGAHRHGGLAVWSVPRRALEAREPMLTMNPAKRRGTSSDCRNCSSTSTLGSRA